MKLPAWLKKKKTPAAAPQPTPTDHEQQGELNLLAFTELPSDLLLQIWGHLGHRSKHSFALACRATRALATEWTTTIDDVIVVREGKGHRLLKTLQRFPNLEKCNLKVHAGAGQEELRQVLHHPDARQSKLHTIILTTGYVNSPSAVQGATVWNRHDAYALLELPSLHTLSIRSAGQLQQGFIDTLTNLRSLTLHEVGARQHW
jgi:hypothetical protein